MANACGIFRTEEQAVYTDELAEQFAKEEMCIRDRSDYRS